ncbi:TPA: hypothetical protein ACF95C_003664, partial [Salmonella enterica]
NRFSTCVVRLICCVFSVPGIFLPSPLGRTTSQSSPEEVSELNCKKDNPDLNGQINKSDNLLA